jgi:hypothetical protein
MSAFEGSIPGIIRLAESSHVQDMWLLPMLIRSRAVAGDDPEKGDRFFTLPIDYLGMEGLWIVENGTRHPLTQVAPSALIPGQSTPRQFCIHQEIEIDSPLRDDTTVLEMLYYRKFTPLNSTDQSNWLLENHYNAYLFASLVETFMFLRDEDTAALYKTRYDAVVSSILEKNRRSMWTQSDMAVSMNMVLDETP